MFIIRIGLKSIFLVQKCSVRQQNMSEVIKLCLGVRCEYIPETRRKLLLSEFIDNCIMILTVIVGKLPLVDDFFATNKLSA